MVNGWTVNNRFEFALKQSKLFYIISSAFSRDFAKYGNLNVFISSGPFLSITAPFKNSGIPNLR